jgi:hypothetical protein
MRIKLDQVMQLDELLLLHGRGTAPFDPRHICHRYRLPYHRPHAVIRPGVSMPEAVKQIARPAITSSAVLMDPPAGT